MITLKKYKVPVIIISAVLVLAIALASVGAYYLGKIDYDSNRTGATAPTNPLGDDDDADILNSGTLSPEDSSALSDADKDIAANLDNSQVWYSDDVYNVLLMGIDYGSKSYPYGRSDAMIIVSINRKSRVIKLISVSRTAYSAIPGYKNTRLNHAHGYGGPALVIAAIEKNYKIRIDNYASATFDSFGKIIDAFGGIPITLTAPEAKSLNGRAGSFPSAGTYNLNGTQALAYARTRHIDSDKDRTGRQRKVLLAIAQKSKEMPIGTILGMIDVILPLVRTDMSKTQLISQAANAPSYLRWGTQQYVLPHKSSGLVLRDGFEVVLVDWKTEVAYVHDLIYKGVEVKYENA